PVVLRVADLGLVEDVVGVEVPLDLAAKLGDALLGVHAPKSIGA
ncbi:MAG: hypothetical protein QOH73_2140, partial [Gaiellaceae bacterium]|nr:hypothetical protein [Gaiellaceae bacterium]